MAPSSDSMLQPQLLTAAALTWQLLSQAEKRPRAASNHVHHVDDDVPNLDHHAATQSSSSSHTIPIITPEKKKRPSVAPHLIAASLDSSSTSSSSPVITMKPHVKQQSEPKRTRRIVPVVIPESPPIHTTTTTPRVARVSAATMRNLQSRQRVLSAMEHVKQKQTSNHDDHDDAPVVSPHDDSTTPDVIHMEPTLIRFKVRSNNNVVIRFQCLPLFEKVKEEIVKRMNISSPNMVITYKDVEGDDCTLSNDEDLQDAIVAAADVMVRLLVQVERKSFLPSALMSSFKFIKW